MPLTDLARLDAEARSPRIVRLWWALRRLATPVSFMNTGAHPDDETTELLAALALRDGIDISYACATRGEGGQNNIGTETGTALGVLRTAEMERAADVLGLRLYWLCERPGDTIFDFGFSKSGEETLAKWGRERVLARFVEVVRTERPDILCPTFLDVPGQHGHHRAMTQMAHEVFEAAADPAFPCALPPWAPAKLYLPAWSGAGTSYDDDLPPPPATLTVEGRGTDPVTGWSYARIGQQSRAFHRTQGMGRWVAPDQEREFPLHLVAGRTSTADIAMTSGLPVALTQLEVPEIAGHLSVAQGLIEDAIAAFPDRSAVLDASAGALSAIRAAEATCPAAAHGEVGHRLARKRTQLSEVVWLAAAVEGCGRLSLDVLRPGDATEIEIETRQGDAQDLEVTLDLPAGWRASDGDLVLGPAAPLTEEYPVGHLPGEPPVPALAVSFSAVGDTHTRRVALEVAPLVLPSHCVALSPVAAIVNREASPRPLEFAVRDITPVGATPALILPQGWLCETGEALRITPPPEPETGLFTLPLTLDSAAAHVVLPVRHAHVPPRAHVRPAEVRIRVLDAALPKARVGYLGGGQDRVGHWLEALGLDAGTLSDEDLATDAALAAFDSIVVGIFAVRFRPGLAEAMPRLRRWVEAGGTLVTLYHRPWDGWDPDHVPPRRLEIGQPSLRWRVTDENAEVEHLVPDHPLLNTPNRIGPEDWQGWTKERGLYFAKSWDAAYAPLLRMGDPGESLDGALLSADIGAGRHVHTSLVLHTQMEHLVPGSFRIMANLVAPRD